MDRITHLLALMERGDRAFNARDWTTLDTVHHPDMIAHVPGISEPIRGRDAHKAAMNGLFEMFPDIRVETPYEVGFGGGDWITVLTRANGTLAGSEKRFDVEFAQSVRWEAERIIEIRTSGTPRPRPGNSAWRSGRRRGEDHDPPRTGDRRGEPAARDGPS